MNGNVPPIRKTKKQAYWIRPAGGGVVTFGGLMETWHSADGSEIDSGCILTTGSNGLIGEIHDRMPVVIKPQDRERWLDCKTQEPRDIAPLLEPVEDEFFEAVPVGELVNKVANSGPEVQQKVEAVPVMRAAKTKPPAAGQLDLF